jgi:hypothetical protein
MVFKSIELVQNSFFTCQTCDAPDCVILRTQKITIRISLPLYHIHVQRLCLVEPLHVLYIRRNCRLPLSFPSHIPFSKPFAGYPTGVSKTISSSFITINLVNLFSLLLNPAISTYEGSLSNLKVEQHLLCDKLHS